MRRILFVVIILLLLTIIMVSLWIISITINTATKPPEIILDSNGIPLVYYGNTTGYQRNPVTTSLKLMDYSDAYAKTKNPTQLQYLKNNANWLVANEKNYGNYSLLEEKFPFPRYNLTSPWQCALAQGLAIQSLIKAYKITNNATYLDAITPLLNSFYVEVKDGGITEKTNSSGWWYEEYAGNGSKNPRVLNGHEFDLLALYDYYNYTGNTRALYLFNQGILSLKNNISKYDINDGSTYYDTVGLKADHSYQKIHVDLTGKLYEITKEPILKQYHDKWRLYSESHKSLYEYLNVHPLDPRLIMTIAISIMIIATLILGVLIVRRMPRFHFWKNDSMN